MKKALVLFFVLFIGSIIFSACNNNDDDEIPDPTGCDWGFLLENSVGLSDHLTISGAHWVFGNQWNLHGAEVYYHLTEAHGHPDWISDIEATDVKWILDVETYLLDYANHNLFSDIDLRIDTLADLLAGKEDNIYAFYVADEPYLNGKEITRTMLEEAIGKLKTKIPGIPAYIVFTHNYFLTSDLSNPGTQPGSNRGIPNNLDIISFDWYSDATDGSSKRNIEEYVKPTVEEIKKINPSIPILLTGEAFNSNLSDEKLPESIFRYWDYACSEPQIIGVDHFSWADNPSFLGVTSLPKTQGIIKALSKEVRLNRDDMPTDNKIPVYEYVDFHDLDNNRYEYRYDSWFWKGWTTTCYVVKEMKFYIPPSGEANSSDLYLCYLDRTDEVNRGYSYIDHRLSTDANCSGENLAKSSKLLGSVFISQEAGTVPLYEFVGVAGVDHSYSTKMDEYEGINGYQISNNGQAIGYVYPAN